jgi:hypothetical protein
MLFKTNILNNLSSNKVTSSLAMMISKDNWTEDHTNKVEVEGTDLYYFDQVQGYIVPDNSSLTEYNDAGIFINKSGVNYIEFGCSESYTPANDISIVLYYNTNLITTSGTGYLPLTGGTVTGRINLNYGSGASNDIGHIRGNYIDSSSGSTTNYWQIDFTANGRSQICIDDINIKKVSDYNTGSTGYLYRYYPIGIKNTSSLGSYLSQNTLSVNSYAIHVMYNGGASNGTKDFSMIPGGTGRLYIGYSTLVLGNSMTVANNNYAGSIRLYRNGTGYTDILTTYSTNTSSNYEIYLPNNSGTIALTSDIPEINGGLGLEGSGIYVPTTSGEQGSLLMSNGTSDVPSWTDKSIYIDSINTSDSSIDLKLNGSLYIGSGYDRDFDPTVTISDGTITADLYSGKYKFINSYDYYDESSDKGICLPLAFGYDGYVGKFEDDEVSIYYKNGSNTVNGFAKLIIGNNYKQGTNFNSEGSIRLYTSSTGSVNIVTSPSDDSYTVTLPSNSGTLALVSDIETMSPKININGDSESDTSVIYSPIESGTNGSLLRSNGKDKDPTWTDDALYFNSSNLVSLKDIHIGTKSSEYSTNGYDPSNILLKTDGSGVFRTRVLTNRLEFYPGNAGNNNYLYYTIIHGPNTLNDGSNNIYLPTGNGTLALTSDIYTYTTVVGWYNSTSNLAASNGSVSLNLVKTKDNKTYTVSSYKIIKGTNGINVTSDSNGTIIIDGSEINGSGSGSDTTVESSAINFASSSDTTYSIPLIDYSLSEGTDTIDTIYSSKDNGDLSYDNSTGTLNVSQINTTYISDGTDDGSISVGSVISIYANDIQINSDYYGVTFSTNAYHNGDIYATYIYPNASYCFDSSTTYIKDVTLANTIILRPGWQSNEDDNTVMYYINSDDSTVKNNNKDYVYLTLPTKDGKLALVDDIPKKISDLTNDDIGDDTQPIYMKDGVLKPIKYSIGEIVKLDYEDSEEPYAISNSGDGDNVLTERAIYYGLPTINGAHDYTSDTNIYAPTSGGTSGYFLTSNGSSVPTWFDGVFYESSSSKIVFKKYLEGRYTNNSTTSTTWKIDTSNGDAIFSSLYLNSQSNQARISYLGSSNINLTVPENSGTIALTSDISKAISNIKYTMPIEFSLDKTIKLGSNNSGILMHDIDDVYGFLFQTNNSNKGTDYTETILKFGDEWSKDDTDGSDEYVDWNGYFNFTTRNAKVSITGNDTSGSIQLNAQKASTTGASIKLDGLNGRVSVTGKLDVSNSTVIGKLTLQGVSSATKISSDTSVYSIGRVNVMSSGNAVPNGLAEGDILMVYE